jgi:hypothetical protein
VVLDLKFLQILAEPVKELQIHHTSAKPKSIFAECALCQDAIPPGPQPIRACDQRGQPPPQQPEIAWARRISLRQPPDPVTQYRPRRDGCTTGRSLTMNAVTIRAAERA